MYVVYHHYCTKGAGSCSGRKGERELRDDVKDGQQKNLTKNWDWNKISGNGQPESLNTLRSSTKTYSRASLPHKSHF